MNVHTIRGAHLQCMEQSLCKDKIKRNEICVSYRLHKPGTPYAFRMEKMSKFNTLKNEKYLSNEHRIRGAHLQCMNNH